jgi:hypothetical protein
MAFDLTGKRITVEGLGLGDCPPVITFPSGQIPAGQPGRDLQAALIQINAVFGFNTTPHSFSTSWVPTRDDPQGFHGASGQAPAVGNIIGFSVGEFLVSGEILHSEYSVNTQGSILQITVRDTRRCLDAIKLVTEDLGNNPGSGTISVARAVRITKGFTDLEGNVSEELFREYRKVLEQGCTYPQILDAIQLAVDEGEIEFDINKIPSKEDLEANLGGDAAAIRFNFDAQPLTEALTRVLESTAYDWYWSMSEQKVRLVNRKVAFELREDELFNIVAELGAVSGLEQTISLQFGDDLVTQPRRVRLLGAHQEGWLNSTLLGPLDGVTSPESGIIFTPAWPNFSVQFTDAAGILRSYKPHDIELQAALKGIEHWTYFKKYQTAAPNLGFVSPGFGIPQDAGSIAAQHPDFSSRLDPAQPLATIGGNESGQLRLINNRRDASQNWVLNFYNRVRDHATRFYGRAYLASGILANAASGAFQLTNAAWGNIENQVEGQDISVDGSSGLFVNNYEINRDLSPLAPFKGTDDKIAPHAVLPAYTVYGPEGTDPPASFGQWTEDHNIGNEPATSGRRARTGEHYIPISLTEVGQLVIDPRDPLTAFEEYPEGTVLCELPIIAGSGLREDFTFRNLVTLSETALSSTSSGLFDVANPAFLIAPYTELSGVAIPIVFTERYGMSFPQAWVSGVLATDCDSEVVVIDDQFAPWNFPPQGRTTSLQLMEDRAFRRLQGLIAPASSSQFAKVELVGLPTISFDAFSNQTPDASGQIGVRNHGITDVNFSLSAGGVRTNYRIASFFAEFGREVPLGERQRAILNGIITPIDTDPSSPLAPQPRTRPLLPQQPIFSTITGRGEQISRATITEVNFALTFDNIPDAGTQERYRGDTLQGYTVPARIAGDLDADFEDAAGQGGALCLDGFLNIDDEALYHVNESRLPAGRREIQRYWTGGRPFSNGTVVFVSGIGSSSDTFDVAILDTNPLRRLVDIPLLNGAVNVGERSTLAAQASQATPRVLGRPGSSLTTPGVFLNPGGNASLPVQVTSISDPGTSGAIVTVKKLTDNGDVDQAATPETNVIPIPHPEFIIIGDKGVFLSTAVLNTDPDVPGTGEEQVGKFFFSNRQNFLKFT